ncbi:hypothetical protein [Colwellia sp. RSH04]|uniref:hypothetical protein n=1 Tax=Colwellia sp. RSH04 TaxID=2305464 RepID=UPI000E56FD1B|nr:hypothetical protein [Colwellia sp. RSH04]RHW77132.1 hypothetical protein D1094_04365 [Colwellia sp. RSH04]
MIKYSIDGVQQGETSLLQIKCLNSYLEGNTNLDNKASTCTSCTLDSHKLMMYAFEELDIQTQDAFNNALEKVLADELNTDCAVEIESARSLILNH